MGDDMKRVWLVGVDGCRAGWVAAFVRPDGHEVCVRVVDRFADVMEAPEAPVVIAIDIPIGLPDHIGPEGRGPERAIRPLLGARQSSVFSVPSRTAIYAADFGAACTAALATSNPPRKVSRQLFMIAPKIKESTVCCALIAPPSEGSMKSIRNWPSGGSTANGRSISRRK
jgi:predicted RNase H-like nuclease